MATAKIKNTDNIECTLEFTMKLGDWKKVRQTLNSTQRYAEIKIINEISDLVKQLEQTFYDEVEKDA